MNPVNDRHIKRRLQTSSLSTMLSISLVLLMIGSMGLIYLNTSKLTNYIKENIGISLVLNDNIKKVDRLQLQKNLQTSEWVKSTQYISKQDAANILKNDLGEDFIAFLGYNPLSSSIEVFLNGQFASQENFKTLSNDLKNNELINEIIIQKDLIDSINTNVRKLSLVLISFCVLLLIVSIALINNTIRLTVYSKRFIIRTMKLIGATDSFVRKPFIKTGVLQGIFSGLIGVLLLVIILLSIEKEMPELLILQDLFSLLMVFIGTFLFGLIISFIVTLFAVNKYLNMNEKNLYR